MKLLEIRNRRGDGFERSIKYSWILFSIIIFIGTNNGCKSSGNHSGNTAIVADTVKTSVKAEQKQEILPNTAYKVAIPNANKVELPNNRGAFTFRLIKALVEPKTATKKQLTLSIRAIFEGIGQGAFWEENFLLSLENGDVVNPDKLTKDMVNPSKLYNKDISYTIPIEENRVMLIIMGLSGKSATLNLDLTKVQN